MTRSNWDKVKFYRPANSRLVWDKVNFFCPIKNAIYILRGTMGQIFHAEKNFVSIYIVPLTQVKGEMNQQVRFWCGTEGYFLVQNLQEVTHYDIRCG